MKMPRCSSSPDKKAVLMSPDTNFHLFDATHCMISASACAENVRLSRRTSITSGSCNPRTQKRALTAPADFHAHNQSSSHVSILVTLSAAFLSSLLVEASRSPLRHDDSTVAPVVVVLPASRLVVAAAVVAVAVSVAAVVLRSAVDAAGPQSALAAVSQSAIAMVAVVHSVKSVLTSASMAAAVHFDPVVVHVFFLLSGPLHQVSSPRAFLPQLGMPSEHVLLHT